MKNRISAWTRYPSDPDLACERAHTVIDFCHAVTSIRHDVPLHEAHLWLPLELDSPYRMAHQILKNWEKKENGTR